MPAGTVRPSALARFKKQYLERRTSIIQFDEDSPTHAAVYTLDLSQKDLRRLKNNFELIDLLFFSPIFCMAGTPDCAQDGSGEIDYDEFFEMINDKRTPYSEALFKFIDCDNSGAISFEEFIQVATTYCMYNKEDILRFCFNLFDTDGSGTIDENEFVGLSHTMNKVDPMFPGNFTTALQQFDANDDGLLDFKEFRELSKRYPLMFFPAFRLQKKLWANTLGTRKWMKIHRTLTLNRRLAEYAALHGGSLPPITFTESLFSCCYGHPHTPYLQSQQREKARLKESAKRIEKAVKEHKRDVEERQANPEKQKKKKKKKKKKQTGKGSSKVIVIDTKK